MPMKQSGSNNTVFVGTHNEVEGIQYSITGNEALQNSVFESKGSVKDLYIGLISGYGRLIIFLS